MSDTIIKPPPPVFGINEIVYLKESAMLGYLESVKVYAIRFSTEHNRNLYTFRFNKSPKINQIAGDAIDLRRSISIELSEDNLLSLKDALEIKIHFLKDELQKSEEKYSRMFS